MSPALTRQSSYLVLDNTSLSDQQSSLIRATAEVLFVTPSEAGCLLRHYGWKSRKLQQEWFEAQKQVRESVGLTSEEDAIRPPRTAEGLVQCCSAYCDEVPPEDAHALNCGHVFCSELVNFKQCDAKFSAHLLQPLLPYVSRSSMCCVLFLTAAAGQII